MKDTTKPFLPFGLPLALLTFLSLNFQKLKEKNQFLENSNQVETF